MKLELKSIGYWSLLKISFVINFVLGLVGGFLYALFLGFFITVAGKLGGLDGFGISQGELPAFGIMIIIFPLLFGFGAAVFNTIVYIILAFVYNITAKAFGGLELNFNEVPEASPYMVPQYPPRQSAVPPTQAPPPSGASYGPASTPPQAPPEPPKPTTPPPPPPPVQPYPEPPQEEEKKDEGNQPDDNPPGPSGV